MCAFWLNTYRFEKYEHFWASSLLKFDEFYENVNNADVSQGKCIVAIGSRDELPIPCRKVIIYAWTMTRFDKTIKQDHRDIVDTVCQWLDQHIISTIMNNVTMCIHEQCVPNLAVPPWRPGYEANECVYMCTFRLYSAQGNLILCLNLSQTSLHYAQKIISFLWLCIMVRKMVVYIGWFT